MVAFYVQPKLLQMLQKEPNFFFFECPAFYLVDCAMQGSPVERCWVKSTSATAAAAAAAASWMLPLTLLMAFSIHAYERCCKKRSDLLSYRTLFQANFAKET